MNEWVFLCQKNATFHIVVIERKLKTKIGVYNYVKTWFSFHGHKDFHFELLGKL